MTPRPDLSSTGFILANPGREYPVLQPGEDGESFTVELAAGTYDVEWFAVGPRGSAKAERVRLERNRAVPFTQPSDLKGPACST